MHRVGLLGDIHTEDRALEFALRRFADEAVDAVLSVGDIVDGFGDVERTIELLREHDVWAVAGNHDRWFLRGELRSLHNATLEVSDLARAWLKGLPPTRRFASVAGPVLLCHGVGVDDMAQLTPDSSRYDIESNGALLDVLRTDVRVMIGGHTHRRMQRWLDQLWVVNPGTLHREHEPGFAIIDLHDRCVEFIEVEANVFSCRS